MTHTTMDPSRQKCFLGYSIFDMGCVHIPANNQPNAHHTLKHAIDTCRGNNWFHFCPVWSSVMGTVLNG